MRKASSGRRGEMRTEYCFDYATAVRGKHFARLTKNGSNVVVLEPDVAESFRTSEAVNKALRSLLDLSEETRRLTRHSGGSKRVTRPTPDR